MPFLKAVKRMATAGTIAWSMTGHQRMENASCLSMRGWKQENPGVRLEAKPTGKLPESKKQEQTETTKKIGNV